uniref:DUF6821 domain-containing protein n=1 Tax=Lotus japonicus TaxID=34305 RepID=I3S7H1_LOTJA|nr:unknown [Lotus japonicus]
MDTTNDWVLLSDDGSLDGGDENQIFLGKSNPESKSDFDMNYFYCTSPKSRDSSTTQLLHDDPIQFVENTEDDHVGDNSDTTSEKIKAVVVEADEQETLSVSRFFLQLENKFADMKMDSPKSSPRVLFPPPLDAGALKFEDKGEAMEVMVSPRRKVENEMATMDCDREEVDPTDGFNFWKWSLTGVGAICSFGVAAATICVLVFGSQQKNKFHQNHKIQFQIYTDDKRIKQVVQQATKLNEAIAATRGIPLSRAHITYGGYYEAL